MAYTLLHHINQSSHKWKILIRLARVWEFRNPRDAAEIYHLDFVMLDEQGHVMEGVVPQKWLHIFTPLLKERSIYEIEYFEVLDAKQAYKAVHASNFIRFSKYTKVKEILPEPDAFPIYAYNVVPFSILNDRIGKNALLSDVVALITSASPVTQTTTKLGPTVKRSIKITDGSQSALITLWGQHAELFNAEPLLTTSQTTLVIVLFVGMLVGTYSGKLALQSTSATKWYINIPIPEIQALRNTISDHPHQIEWQQENPTDSNPTSATVQELLELIPNEALGQRYKVSILITGLVPPQSWWYLACSLCWKKTFPHGDAYKCERCPGTAAEPRYRINVYATDANASEQHKHVHAEFMFFGDISQELVGRPPMLLVATTEGQTNYVPPEINAIVGRKYEVIAQMSEGSLQSDTPTFRMRSLITQLDGNKLLLTDNPEATASTSMKIQSGTHHAEQNLSIPFIPPATVATHIQTPSQLPTTPIEASQLTLMLPSDKKTHHTLMSTESDLPTSTTELDARSIQPTKKVKTARELFPDENQ